MKDIIMNNLANIVDLSLNSNPNNMRENVDKMLRMFIVLFHDIYINHNKFYNISLRDLYNILNNINKVRWSSSSQLNYNRLVINKEIKVYVEDAKHYLLLFSDLMGYLSEIIMDKVIEQSKNYSNILDFNCEEQINIIRSSVLFNSIKFGCSRFFDPNYYINNKKFFIKIAEWIIQLNNNYIYELNKTNGYKNIIMSYRIYELQSTLVSKIVNNESVEEMDRVILETSNSVLDIRTSIGLSFIQINDYIYNYINDNDYQFIKSNFALDNLLYNQTLLVNWNPTLNFAILIDNLDSSMYYSMSDKFKNPVKDIRESEFYNFYSSARNYKNKIIKHKKTFNLVKIYKNLKKKKVPRYILAMIRTALMLYIGPINPEILFQLLSTFGDIFNDGKDYSDVMNIIQKYNTELKNIIETYSNKLDKIDKKVKMLTDN